jgi:hypothetical protein
MGSLFEAALSAHYHIAALRAEHDTPKDRVNYRSWKALHDAVPKVGEPGALLSRVRPPDRAVDLLRTHHRDRVAARGPTVPHSQAVHADAAWCVYHRLCRQYGTEPDPDVSAHLSERLDSLPTTKAVKRLKHNRDLLEKDSTTPNYDKLFLYFLQTLAPHANIDDFYVDEAQCKDGVTRFKATITGETQTDLAKVVNLADPRRWTLHYPSLFAKAYRIATNGTPRYTHFCTDRYLDPDPLDPDPHGGDSGNGGWKGLFFEKAEIDLQNIAILKGRNVLDMEFVIGPDHNHDGDMVSLKYSLVEALSNNVLWFSSPAGPDVDSGVDDDQKAICTWHLGKIKKSERKVKKSETGKADTRSLKVSAGKHLRFSPQACFPEEQNAFALPLWSASIIAGLVKSVTLESSSNGSLAGGSAHGKAGKSNRR